MSTATPLAGRATNDYLVENRLDPCTARNGAQDTADRALLFADVLELASELGVVGGHEEPSRLASRRTRSRSASP